jgi:cyclin D5, plant
MEHAWGLLLLTVASLSLADTLEEHPALWLSQFPLDACEFTFDRVSVPRMELLVLGILEWWVVVDIPFPYIRCFVAQFRQDERRAICERAVQHHCTSYLKHRGGCTL